MADEQKRVISDVTKPESSTPITGSKPVIVGHKEMVKDPMVKEEAMSDKEAQLPSQTAKKIEPLTVASKPEVPGEVSETSKTKEETSKTQDPEPQISETAKDAVAQDKKDEQEAERELKLQELVKSKNYNVQVSKPSKGSKPTITLALLLVLSLVGGYLLLDAGVIKSDIKLPFDLIKQNSVDGESTNTGAQDQSQASVAAERQEDVTEISSSISEVNIKLVKVGDENKLPASTPASFIAYMKEKLEAFDCDDPSGSIEVEKISDRFASGLVGCDGGYGAFWYLDGEVWKEFGTQDAVPCSDLVETKIPADFIPTCMEEQANGIWTDEPNPNGTL